MLSRKRLHDFEPIAHGGQAARKVQVKEMPHINMANLLRLRLSFKNFRPGVGGDCWFLLDPGICRQVSDFMKEIKAKFQLGPFPLRCSTKGFLLPPNENIAIIRDEDEIIVEEEDIENATFVQDGFGESNEVVQSFNDNHQHFISHAGDSSKQKRKLKEGNMVNLKSKKRRKDESTKESDVMVVKAVVADVVDTEVPKTKTQKKKKKSKTREHKEVEKASKDQINIEVKKMKQANDTINCGKSLMKVVKRVDKKPESTKNGKQKKETTTDGIEASKNSLQRKEITGNEERKDDALGEEISSTKHQKQKGKKKVSNDNKNSAIKNKSAKEEDKIDEVESKSEVEEDERPSFGAVSTEKIISARGNPLMKGKAVKKMKEANNKAIVSSRNPEPKNNDTFEEKSFQIMERKEDISNQTSTPLASLNPHHAKKVLVSSTKAIAPTKKDGSHIYFGSDNDDDDEKCDNVLPVNSHKIEEANLNLNNAKYSDKSAKNKALQDRLINISRIYVNAKNNPQVNENNNNLYKKPKKNLMSQNEKDINMKGIQSENTLSTPNAMPNFVASSFVNKSNLQADTAVDHDKTNVAKDYSTYPSLQGAPRVGDKIAFKILELSLSYTPEVSDFKEAVIQGIDQSTGVAQLMLSEDSRKRISGDGSISRKFELEELEEDEEYESQLESIMEINWKELVEPKLL